MSVRPGDVLTGLCGTLWTVGAEIGQGAFGAIFTASDGPAGAHVPADTPYVVKVEKYESGPLFVEINCYIRIAKPASITEWCKLRKLPYLGMPYYISSGTHVGRHGENGERFRFLVMPRYGEDIEKKLAMHGNYMNLKTAVTVAQQVLHTLEYIHAHGYVHADIKAANILLANYRTNAIKTGPTMWSDNGKRNPSIPAMWVTIATCLDPFGPSLGAQD